MFKTLYSRYGNVKAGKFVAGAGEEADSEEFEALNDIEKVVNKIGIKIRTTSAEFRNFDDVLADIAEKWITLSDVEQNAIGTAFAGTRQREYFNILMENYDQVDKFENIAENSEGSTAEKMDIYGDSVEASQNRKTAAIEEFTQNFNIFGMDGSEILTKWNDLLTYIIKNWKEITAFILTVTTLSKGLLSGSMFGGLLKIMQSLTVRASNFASTMQTMGTNLYNSPIMGLLPRTVGATGTLIGQLGTKVGQGIGDLAHNGYNMAGVATTKVGSFLSEKWNSVAGNYTNIRDMRALDGARLGDRLSSFGMRASNSTRSFVSSLLSRQTDGRIADITSADGNILSLSKNATGRKLQLMDADGNRTSLGRHDFRKYDNISDYKSESSTLRNRVASYKNIQDKYTDGRVRWYNSSGSVVHDSSYGPIRNWMLGKTAKFGETKLGQKLRDWSGRTAEDDMMTRAAQKTQAKADRAQMQAQKAQEKAAKSQQRATTKAETAAKKASENTAAQTVKASKEPGMLGQWWNTVKGPLGSKDGTPASQSWRSKTLSQMQDTQGQRVYSAAMKAGQDLGIDGIQSDRVGQFLSGMNAEQAEVWNKLSADEQQELIKQYGAEDPQVEMNNAIMDNTTALRDNTSALRGENDGKKENQGDTNQNDTNTDQDNLPNDNGQQLSMFDENDELIDANRPQPSVETGEQLPIQGLDNLDDAADKLNDSFDDMNKSTGKLSQAQIDAAKSVGLIGDDGKGYVSTLNKSDASATSVIAHQQRVQKEMDKKAKMQNLKGAGASALAMGTAMVSGMGMSEHVSGTGWSESTQNAASMTASMAPMIGMMFGPWGALAGSAVSLGLTAFTAFRDGAVETAEEIREAGQKAQETLSNWAKNIEEATKQNEELENLDTRFAELLKGVDINTGMNISLDTSEWEEYQSILEKIIDASDDLYKSYNAQGDVIAKSHTGFVDLNEALKKTVLSNNEKIAYNAEQSTNDIGARTDVLKKTVVDAEDQSKSSTNYDNDYGLNWDDWYFTSEKSIRVKDGKYDVYRGENTDGEETKDHIVQFVKDAKKAGMSKDKIIEGLGKIGIEHGLFGVDATKKEIEKLVNNISNEIDSRDAKENIISQKYSEQITKDMQTALKSNAAYFTLDSDTQSYMQNLVGSFQFDAYQKNQDGTYKKDDNDAKIKKTEDQMTNDLRISAEAAQNLVSWTADNMEKSSYIQNFDLTNANSDQWKIRESYVKDMINAISSVDMNDNGKIDKDEKSYDLEIEAAKKNGYIVNEENLERDSSGKIVGYKTNKGKHTDNIFDVAQDQRDTLWNSEDFKDIKNKLGSEFSADSFSYGQLQLLNKYKDSKGLSELLNSTDGKVTARDIVNYLQKLQLGTNAQASQYFSLLSAEVNEFSGNASDLVETLNNVNNSGLFSVEMLKKFADNLNMLDDNGNVLDSFADAFEFLGDINIDLMTTSKTLAQIEEQYQIINDAITDINDNGKISSTNLESVLKAYPELIQYLGDTDTLLKKLNSGSATYDTKIIASLKGKITGSKEALYKYVDDNDIASDATKIFNNIDSMAGATNVLYHKDEKTGKYVLNKDYESLKLRGKDYSEYSWAKILAENVFGITTDGKNKETVDKELFTEMKSSLVSSGQITQEKADTLDMTNADDMRYLMEFFTMQLKNPQYMMAHQNVLDAQAEVNAIKAKMDLEDENIKQQINDYVSNIEDKYNNGNLSTDQYISGLNTALNELESQGFKTSEEFEELQEKIEDVNFDNLTEKIEEGGVSYSTARSELSTMAKNNVVGSEDWDQAVDTAIGQNDEIISANNSKINMLEIDSREDFTTKRGLKSANMDAYTKKLAEIKAAGELEYGSSYNPENDPRYIETREQLYNEIQGYTETFEEEKGYLNAELSAGRLSRQDYINSLQEMIDSGELTAEQIKEFGEEVETTTRELREVYADRGVKLDKNGKVSDSNYTGAEFRRDTLKDIKNQQRDSDEEQQLISQYFSSFDTDMNKNDVRAQMAANGNYNYTTTKGQTLDRWATQEYLYKKNAELAHEKAESYLAAGYSEDSTEVINARQKAAEWMNKSAWVDVEKADDEFSKGTMSLQEYSSELEKLKDKTGLSATQMEELAEKAEDAASQLAKMKSEKTGNYNTLRTDALKRIKNNKEGTDDRQQAEQDLLSVSDSQVSKNNTLIDLAKGGYYNYTTTKGKTLDRWATQEYLHKKNAQAYEQRARDLIALGYSENSAEVLNARSQAAQEMNKSAWTGVEKADDEFSKGKISLQEYSKTLTKLKDKTGLSAEQLEELAEKAEDAAVQLGKYKFEKYSSVANEKSYRQSLLNKISNNKEGTDDRISAERELLEINDTKISKNNTLLDLAKGGYYNYITTGNYTMDRWQTQAYMHKSNAASYNKKAKQARELGYQDEALKYEAQAIQEMNQAAWTKVEKFDDQFSKGYLSIDEYTKGLADSYDQLSKSGQLSAEQLEEFAEKIEDANVSLAKYNFDKDVTTGDTYREVLMNKIQSNAEGTDDRQSAIAEYMASYDKEISVSETKASMLADNDFVGKAGFLSDDVSKLTEKLSFMAAAGLEESEEYYQTASKLVAKKKEQLDLEKQIYEYEIQKSGEVLDAYSNILSYGIDELKKHQQDINDMYDDEISKLQDINDQKQRSIELTRLEQELENAKKEKVRVYQAGVGFTYQSNKAKVKEAKQNLEKFNDEQHISDLKHAQEAQNKLIEDQIKRLTDIQDYISNIKKTADTTASLMDLKKNGIVPHNATISDAINQITKEALNGPDGKIATLGTSFDAFAKTYEDNSVALAGYLDNIEAKLAEIAGYDDYAIDDDKKDKFSSQLDAKPETPTFNPESKTIDKILEDFIGKAKMNDINESLKDISDAISESENGSSVKTEDPKTSSIDTQLSKFLGDTTMSQIKTQSKAVENAVRTSNRTTPKNKNDKGININDKLASFLGETKMSEIKTNINNVKSAINNKVIPNYNSTGSSLYSTVKTIAGRLGILIGHKSSFGEYVKAFKSNFGSIKVSKMPALNIKTSDLLGELKAANARLQTMQAVLLQEASAKKTLTDGTWGSDKKYYNIYTGGVITDATGKKYYQFRNTETKKLWWTSNRGNKFDKVEEGSSYWSREELVKMGILEFATGIENGPVTYTGLAMLHGSPSSPEYVLNTKQAGTLLKNLSTMTMSPYQAPTVDSYGNQTQVITYQFNGDMNLPNVQRPDQFFDELLKQANVQFPTIKGNY